MLLVDRRPPRFPGCHPFCDVFLSFLFEVVALQPMLRSHTPALPHSYLRATNGSTFVARRAGIQAATKTTAINEMKAMPRSVGSCARTSNKRDCSRRADAHAPDSPRTEPTIVHRPMCARTI